MVNWASQLWQSVRRLWRISVVKGAVWGVAAFFITQIISSLIQDAFPEWMKTIFIPWLLKPSAIVNWLIIALALFFVAALVVTYRLSKAESWLDPKDIRTLKYASEYLHYKSFIELLTGIDDDVRRLLSRGGDIKEIEVKNLLDDLFVKTFDFLGSDVRTGVIFRPGKDDPEWLVGWKSSPGHYLTEKKFYIGKDRAKYKDRGSAGEAYVKNIPQKYNILDPLTGDADDPIKKKFPAYEKKRGGANYLSSINLPIRWNKRVIGVMAVDSKKRNFFTDEDIEMLQIVADRIGDALYLRRVVK